MIKIGSIVSKGDSEGSPKQTIKMKNVGGDVDAKNINIHSDYGRRKKKSGH